jgi:flavin-dependent dehydrogenase
MPYIQPGCPVDFGTGRILFAGETANFLNPIGEGISSALQSGIAAAESLAYAYDNIDFNPRILLDTYKNNISNERDYMIRQWNLMANISSKFDYMRK